MGKSKGELIITFGMGLGIVFGLSAHITLTYNLKAGLLYFGVFGTIVGFLLFLFFKTRR